jgi:hypothetical protein
VGVRCLTGVGGESVMQAGAAAAGSGATRQNQNHGGHSRGGGDGTGGLHLRLGVEGALQAQAKRGALPSGLVDEAIRAVRGVAERRGRGYRGGLQSAEPPAYLRCPVTHELMDDPVVVCTTGQTYDRGALEEWFHRHKPATDPATNVVLRDTAVVRFLGDAKSSLGDAKSSLGDAESSLGDTESSLGDVKSLLGDAKSSLGDAESSLGDAESSLGDVKSLLGDAKSSLGDAKSSLGDAESSLGDGSPARRKTRKTRRRSSSTLC